MIPRSGIEKLAWAFVIAMIVAALVLIACSPPYFLSGKVVYQGF